MKKLKSFDLVFKFNKDEIGYRQYRTYLQALQYKRLIYLVEKYTDEHTEILDWGGGAGHVSAMLALLKRNVTLFSIVNKKVYWETLTKHFNINFLHDPTAVRELNIKQDYFSSIISCGVLEHVRETGGDEIVSLKNLTRSLKVNGTIIIYHLPLRYSYIEWISRNFTKSYTHPFRYTLRDINDIVAAVENLDIVEYGKYQFVPRRIFGKFPLPRLVAICIDTIDRLLCCTPLSNIAQCQYVVLRKT